MDRKTILAAALAAMAALAIAQEVASVTPDQLAPVRRLVAQYEDVKKLEAAGYERFGDCMAEAGLGAQGIHYVHPARMRDTALDPLAPELFMYEPRPDGSLRLIGVEYFVFKKAWHDAGNTDPPKLLGQTFPVNEKLLSEPFYGLHLWVWHHNPSGLFAGWNPLVTCP